MSHVHAHSKQTGGPAPAPARASAPARPPAGRIWRPAGEHELQRANARRTALRSAPPAIDQTVGTAPVPSAPPRIPATFPPVTVGGIDIVNSPAGAVTGHPRIKSGNLDVPGPYNNPATGGVNNVHQIHFRVDSGSSAALKPRREIQRSAWFGAGPERQNPQSQPLPPGQAGPPATGGFGGVRVGPDGPARHEIRRPSASLLSVADAPGTRALTAAQCPFIYRSHFSVTVSNPAGVDVARAKYDVRIEKRTPTEVPNTENTITTVDKVDLVRRRSLA